LKFKDSSKRDFEQSWKCGGFWLTMILFIIFIYSLVYNLYIRANYDYWLIFGWRNIMIYFLSGIRVHWPIRESVVFTLGSSQGVREPGLRYIFVIFQRIVTVDMRVRLSIYKNSRSWQRDNVPIDVNGVVFFKVLKIRCYNQSSELWVCNLAICADCIKGCHRRNEHLIRCLLKDSNVGDEIRKL